MAHLPASSNSSTSSASPVPSVKVDVISRLTNRFSAYRDQHIDQQEKYSKLFASTVDKSKVETDSLRNQYFANSQSCSNNNSVNNGSCSTGSTPNGTPTTTSGGKTRNKRPKKNNNDEADGQPASKTAKTTKASKAKSSNQQPILPAPPVTQSQNTRMAAGPPSSRVPTPGSVGHGSVPSSPLHCNGSSGQRTPDIKPSVSLMNNSMNNNVVANGHHQVMSPSSGPSRMATLADIKREIMDHPHSQLSVPFTHHHMNQQPLPDVEGMPGFLNGLNSGHALMPNNNHANCSDDNISFENLFDGLPEMDETNPNVHSLLHSSSSSSLPTTFSSQGVMSGVSHVSTPNMIPSNNLSNMNSQGPQLMMNSSSQINHQSANMASNSPSLNNQPFQQQPQPVMQYHQSSNVSNPHFMIPQHNQVTQGSNGNPHFAMQRMPQQQPQVRQQTVNHHPNQGMTSSPLNHLNFNASNQSSNHSSSISNQVSMPNMVSNPTSIRQPNNTYNQTNNGNNNTYQPSNANMHMNMTMQHNHQQQPPTQVMQHNNNPIFMQQQQQQQQMRQPLQSHPSHQQTQFQQHPVRNGMPQFHSQQQMMMANNGNVSQPQQHQQQQQQSWQSNHHHTNPGMMNNQHSNAQQQPQQQWQQQNNSDQSTSNNNMAYYQQT